MIRHDQETADKICDYIQRRTGFPMGLYVFTFAGCTLNIWSGRTKQYYDIRIDSGIPFQNYQKKMDEIADFINRSELHDKAMKQHELDRLRISFGHTPTKTVSVKTIPVTRDTTGHSMRYKSSLAVELSNKKRDYIISEVKEIEI